MRKQTALYGDELSDSSSESSNKQSNFPEKHEFEVNEKNIVELPMGEDALDDCSRRSSSAVLSADTDSGIGRFTACLSQPKSWSKTHKGSVIPVKRYQTNRNSLTSNSPVSSERSDSRPSLAARFQPQL